LHAATLSLQRILSPSQSRTDRYGGILTIASVPGGDRAPYARSADKLRWRAHLGIDWKEAAGHRTEHCARRLLKAEGVTW